MWGSRSLIPVVLISLLCLFLSACEADHEVAVRPSVRPVKTLLLEEAAGMMRSFPASIEASNRVDLAFRVAGKLNSLQVQEGDIVVAGQVLASLDPTDYRLALEGAEAEYDRASGDWERAKVLVVDGHLSRTDFDQVESTFKQAMAAREQARLDLSYAELKAPIAGTIARRYIQNFEEVSARQQIFALRDNSELEVRVNIPEQMMSILVLNQEQGSDDGLWVMFPAASEDKFALHTKEIATRADPDTQTFQVRLTFEAPEHLNVLPGMSAVVVVNMKEFHADRLKVMLPVAAVDYRQGDTRLWFYNTETGSARPMVVSVGPEIGGSVEILDGVAFGDRIIIAGVSMLDESMKLYEMRKVEQAE